MFLCCDLSLLVFSCFNSLLLSVCLKSHCHLLCTFFFTKYFPRFSTCNQNHIKISHLKNNKKKQVQKGGVPGCIKHTSAATWLIWKAQESRVVWQYCSWTLPVVIDPFYIYWWNYPRAIITSQRRPKTSSLTITTSFVEGR